MPTTAKCPCCPTGAMNHVSLPVLRQAQAAERKARAATERAEAAVDDWQKARRKVVRRRVAWLVTALAVIVAVLAGYWLYVAGVVFVAVWLVHWWQEQTGHGRRVRNRRRKRNTARRNFGHVRPGGEADRSRRILLRTEAYELHEAALLALTSAEKNCPAAWRFPELDERTAARVDAAEDTDGA